MATTFISVLVVLAISFGCAVADDICNQNDYNVMNGTISSPNYPLPYPTNLSCNYTIAVPEGFSVYFRFIEFSTDWFHDQLTAFCANGTTFGQMTFLRERYPSTLLLSSCSEVSLFFRTDRYSNSATGFEVGYSLVRANSVIEGFKIKPSNVFMTRRASDEARPTFNCTSTSGYLPWWKFLNRDWSGDVIITNGYCQIFKRFDFVFISESLGPGSCNLISTSRALTMPLQRYSGIVSCSYGTSVSAASIFAPIDPRIEFSKQRGSPVNTVTDLEAVKDEEVRYSCSPAFGETGRTSYENCNPSFAYSIESNTYAQRSVCLAKLEILRVFWTDETGREITGNGSDRSDVNVKAHLASGVYLFPNYSCNIDVQFFSNITFLDSNVPTTWTFKTGTVRAFFAPDQETMSIVGDENRKINPGGILSCHANAHPPATYHWTDVSTGQLVNGPTISVTHSGQYTCIASNSFARGHHQAEKTITVEVSDDWNRLDKTTLVFVILFGIANLAMNVGFILFLLWKQWKKRKSVAAIARFHRLAQVENQENDFHGGRSDDQ